MAARRCMNRKCTSWRNRRAVWLVDRVPMCNSCMQKFLETRFFDEHSIHRLSENEDDFHGSPRETTTRMPNGPVVV